ncbi:MAG TPA: DNA-processing protein DprA [Thermoanaerobaculia bacterium]|nr:DNA-processing protein DprA [Thermoanaerobaculia bacterium]
MPIDALARRVAVSWARSRDLTPQRLWPVLRDRGSVEALLATPEAELAARLASRERARAVLDGPSDSAADRWAASVETSGIRIVTAFDTEYPKALLEISDPPFLLFSVGRLEKFRLPAVAVVGSRSGTRYGRDVAARLARELSLAGVTIVSGFARGVDVAAHEAAREGPGGTIAVLGCGLDVDYPREHARLKEAMAGTDLLVSEYPPGAEPRPQNFPIRNRIIAGIAAGVVVVEASRRSGSLITARLAADFGRDVFAVPGSVFSDTSVGTHELLRDGAILCRGAEDVLAELFPSIGVAGAAPRASAGPTNLSPEAARLSAALEREEALSADELAQALDLSAATVLAALFELEGAGLVVAEGGRYSAIRR